ncbi:MAG: hypothetical protein PHC29_00710 [Candidatus Omnitrophica bacterium]|nr:hypothetical protein [Candidatus Omnitrophota bacterium]
MSVITLIMSTSLTTILISVIGIIVGLFVFFKPELMIETQKKFYAKINWRIEPISMQKEIRNTRLMGISLVTVATVTIIYFFISLAKCKSC